MNKITMSGSILGILFVIIIYCGAETTKEKTDSLHESRTDDKISCTFGLGDWCDFVLVTHENRDEKWTLTNSETNPHVPHIPSPTPGDWFIYVDFRNTFMKKIKREVRSKKIARGAESTSKFCLKFAMFMEVHETATLRAVLRQDDTHDSDQKESDLMLIHGDNDGKWNNRQVTFNSDTDFTVAFIAQLAPRAVTGVVAIDNITLSPSACSKDDEASQVLIPNKLCDFEEGSCGFSAVGEQEDKDYLRWTVTSFKKLKEDNQDNDIAELAPNKDNTLHTETGHYAFVRFSEKSPRQHKMIYQSPFVDYKDSYCLQFFFRNHRLPVSPAVELAVKIFQEGIETPEKPIWQSSVDYGRKWMSVKTQFPARNKQLALQFIADAAESARGAVAFDDIYLTTGRCPHSGDCSFDEDNEQMCGWRNVEGTSMDWTKGKAETGPQQSSGKYVFFHGGKSSGSLAGARAILSTGDLGAEEQDFQCMTFSYYMTSAGVAMVRVHQVNSAERDNAVWENYGRDPIPVPDLWRLAKIPLSSGTRVVTFEGVILRETEKDYIMAIDEVKFLRGPCEIEPVSSKPEDKPDMVSSDSLCTFDNDGEEGLACGWSLQTGHTGSHWEVLTGGQRDKDDSIPPYDHTSYQEYGSFLYYSSPDAEDTATVQTKPFTRSTPKTPRCLRFWRYFGGGAGSLLTTIRSIKPFDVPEESILLDSKTSLWQSQYLNVPADMDEFYIEFKGRTGQKQSGFAIDDIAVQQHACDVVDCDFEHGACAWENYYDPILNNKDRDELDWFFGTSTILPSLPDRGHFKYVAIQQSTPPGYNAILRYSGAALNTVPQANKFHCLEFEFAHSVSGLGILTLFGTNKYVVDSSAKLLWTGSNGGDAGVWHKGRARLDYDSVSWTPFFQVTTTAGATVEKNKNYGIAVDNIVYKIVDNAASCSPLPADQEPPVDPNVPLIDCAFAENDLCKFVIYNPQELKDKWVLSMSMRDVPAKDKPQPNDYYLGVDLFNSQPVLIRMEARTADNITASPKSKNFCLKFNLFLAVHDMSTLRVIRRTDGRELELMVIVGDENETWNNRQLDFTADSNFTLTFAMDVSAWAKAGVAAIDDIVLLRRTCERNTDMDQGLAVDKVCDFEEGNCGFKNTEESNTPITWTVMSYQKWKTDDHPIELTDLMPKTDNTYHSGAGHYAVALFGDLTTGSHTAVYRSLQLNHIKNVPHCISFFYRYHRKADTPAITLNLRANHVGFNIREIWSSRNAFDHGRKWMAVKRDFIREAEPGVYELRFEATADPSSRGAMAIDDIFVFEGTCSHPGDCEFKEPEICGWQHVTGIGKMTWSHGRAAGGPVATSPYMYFAGGKDSGNMAGSRAIIYSPELSLEQQEYKCITFSYFMNSTGMAVVRVHQVNREDKENAIWENFGRDPIPIPNPWRLAKAPLSPDTTMVTFEGIILRETSKSYVMAIDDVQFLNQSCDAIEPPNSKPIEFEDPPLDFPEAMCTFDDDPPTGPMCGGWAMVPGGVEAKWEPQNGTARTVMANPSIPAYDHSTFEDFGQFLFYNSSANTGSRSRKIRTPGYTRDNVNDVRCLRFWHYFEEEGMGQLTVNILPDTLAQPAIDPVVLFSKTMGWRMVYKHIPVGFLSFKVEFEAGSNVLVGKGGFAIDDISVAQHDCTAVDCNFEHGACSWENYYGEDNLDWWFGTAKTLPSPNDSTQRGYFKYVPIRPSTPTNHNALLRYAGTLEMGKKACLEFDYYFTMGGLGDLNVVWSNYLGLTEQSKVLWTSGNGQWLGRWKQGRIYLDILTQPDSDSTLFFEVKTGLSEIVVPVDKTQGIAIDNIVHRAVSSSSECIRLPIEPSTQPPGQTTTAAPPGQTTKVPPKSEFDCNFEGGSTCSWKIDDSKPSYAWKVMKASEAYASTGGPIMDHTGAGSLTGYYMYSYSDKFENVDKKTRLTSAFFGDAKHRCMTFYYHVFGPGVGSLRVLASSNTITDTPDPNPRLIWSRHSPDEGLIWQRAQVDVNIDEEVHTLIFEAVVGPGKGDIALDDITAMEGPCHVDDNFCDFENGFCNFKPVTDSDRDVQTWQLVSPGNDAYVPIGVPKRDVTLESERGHFFAATRHNQANSSRALTRTPDFRSDTKARCFAFYYYIKAGPNADMPNKFTVTLRTGSEPDVTFFSLARFPSDTKEWLYQAADAPLGKGFFVQFEADISVMSGVSIDEVLLESGPCPKLWDCAFGSESSCKWTQPEDNDDLTFHWQIVSPSNTPGHTGPPHDGSQDVNGWFAMASPDQGKKAELISAPIPPTLQDICITFWYQLSKDTGQRPPCSLNVLTREIYSAGGNTRWIWSLDQADKAAVAGKWSKASVGRTLSGYEKITFEADMRYITGTKCLVALDDIVVTQEQCLRSPVEAEPNIVDFFCDFDDGTSCKFDTHPINTPASKDCLWATKQGRGDQWPMTGPEFDHTRPNPLGTYMYFESGRCFDSKESPKVGAFSTKQPIDMFKNVQQCLTFHYHMYGAPNIFQVWTNFSNGSPGRLNFQRTGSQGDQWRVAHVRIDNPEKDPYNIIFKALVGASRLGDVAVDGISLQEGACPTEPVCDFSDHPALCGFSHHQSMGAHPSFTWKSVKVADLKSTNFPDKFDHTSLAPEGHMAFIEADPAAKKDISAYMVSPVHKHLLGVQNEDKCITFWYQIPVYPDGGHLFLHVLKATADFDFGTPRWAARDGFHASWEFGTVPVDLGEDFKFAFEAVNGLRSIFALDDIEVITGKCPALLGCDFEDGICGWSNVYGDAVDWVVFHGTDDNSLAVGPQADNTLYPDFKGHYLFMSNAYPAQNPLGVDAVVTSQRVSVLSGSFYCFTFWYHMYMEAGQNNGRLELLMRQAGTDAEQSLLVINTIQPDAWIKRSIQVEKFTTDFRLVFKGFINGQEKKNAIAIDDIQGRIGLCEVVPKTFDCLPEGNSVPVKLDFGKVCDQVKQCPQGDDEASCGRCKFDKPGDTNPCGYTISANDELRLAHMTKGAPLSTGVSGSGEGQSETEAYLLADFAHGSSHSSTYMYSQWLHETAAACKVSFWYNSYSTIATGAIISVAIETGNMETVIAYIDRPTTTSGWEWVNQAADIGRISGEFRLVFRIRKPGTQTKGFIALDSILMTSCDFWAPSAEPCHTDDWKCPKTNVCIPADERCDFTDDCGKGDDEEEAVCRTLSPGRCNFDSSLCDWYSDPMDGLKWTQSNGRTSTPYSGPLRDRTTGLKTGGYAHVLSSSKPEDVKKNATLLSGRTLTPHVAADGCRVRFYWHMYGSTMGMFRVFAVNAANPKFAPIEEFEMGGHDYGDSWHRKSLVLSYNKPFKVAFVATMGGNSSDMALDDVSFSPECNFEATPPPPTRPPTTPRTRPEGEQSTQPSKVAAGDGPMSHPNDLGGGAIAGIVIGMMLSVAVTIAVFVFVRYSRSVTGIAQKGADKTYMSFGILNDQDLNESSTDDNEKAFRDLYVGDL